MAGYRASLWSLAAGNLVVGTGSLVVAGMLPGMADELGQTEAATGQTVTAYAIALAIGGPLLAGPVSRLNKRIALMTGLLLLAFANLLAALAPTLEWLVAARLLGGFGAGVVTPVTAAAAAMLAPETQRGRAMAMVLAGFIAAVIAGVPIGVFASSFIGWRATFIGVGVGAVIAMFAIWRCIPDGLRGQRIDGAAWRTLSRSPYLLSVIGVTALQATGQFTLFAFLAPALVAQIDASAAVISLSFFFAGAAGLIATLMMSRVIDRFGPPALAHLSIGAAQLAFVLWPFGQDAPLITMALIALWGSASFTVNGAQQARLVADAPELASATLSLNTSAIYVGQAAGAALGGLILSHLGVYWLAPIAGVVLALALSWSILLAATAAAPRPARQGIR